ncbi:MAG: exopolysaccharide biosynthesis protein [Desulfohalobiaceae bacterium]|nr:exopolysaccharide biosynthesis protein [Desulfohalobiaceae bacterium]
MTQEVRNLGELLDRIGSRVGEDRDRISLGMILETVGSRSFGPLLLLLGVILLSPLSGIPGMPTTMGILVLLIVVQMLFYREHFWLPACLLRRSVGRSRLEKALRWLRPMARFIDRFLQPRLRIFIGGYSVYLVAIVCLDMAVITPLMEVIPFFATSTGAVFTAFGLALIANDGFLALIAFMLTATVFLFVINNFL